MKNKSLIALNIIIILLIIAAIGYALMQKKTPQEVPEQVVIPHVDLSQEQQDALKASIEAEPVVERDKEIDLNQDQVDSYLADFESYIEDVKNAEFNTLQGINDIAQVKRILGDFQGAIDAWSYANYIRPGNSLSFSNLAALYHYDLQEFEKAEEQYMISVANDPDDIPTIRNFYELYFYDFKDNEKAEALLLKANEENIDSLDLLALMGRFYADTEKYEKAIEYYQKVLALAPANDIAAKELQRLHKLVEEEETN